MSFTVPASKQNGHSEEPSLEMLGAPRWYCVSHRRLEERVDRLEEAVLGGAHAKGAAAGRKWGTVFGAFIAAAISISLNHCQLP
jgi:hypothetical protein